MSRRSLPPILALAFVCPTVVGASAMVASGVVASGVARADDAKPKPAWRKEKHIIEVGGYLGALFPSADHGLYAEGVTDAPKQVKTGFDFGVRFAYLPLRFVGVEVEGGASPTRIALENSDKKGRRLTLFAVRASLVLQMPTQLALFVVAGGGMLGVSSRDPLVGKNVDGAFHVGGGLKYYVNKYVTLRIDGRDVITPSYAKATGGEPAYAHSAEFTFGAAFVWGRKWVKMPPKGG